MKPEHIFVLALMLILAGATAGCAQQSMAPTYINEGADQYKQEVQASCMLEVLAAWVPEDTARSMNLRYEACLRGNGVMI